MPTKAFLQTGARERTPMGASARIPANVGLRAQGPRSTQCPQRDALQVGDLSCRDSDLAVRALRYSGYATYFSDVVHTCASPRP
eukprot:5698282-Lingulodinium_polyedra.AAC.1